MGLCCVDDGDLCTDWASTRSKHATLPASSDEASLTEACAERAGGKAEVHGMRAKPYSSTCPWLQTLQG